MRWAALAPALPPLQGMRCMQWQPVRHLQWQPMVRARSPLAVSRRNGLPACAPARPPRHLGRAAAPAGGAARAAARKRVQLGLPALPPPAWLQELPRGPYLAGLRQLQFHCSFVDYADHRGVWPAPRGMPPELEECSALERLNLAGLNYLSVSDADTLAALPRLTEVVLPLPDFAGAWASQVPAGEVLRAFQERLPGARVSGEASPANVWRFPARAWAPALQQALSRWGLQLGAPAPVVF